MRGFRSITSLSHSISQSEKLLPAIVIGSHREEKQSKYRFEKFKGKDTFFALVLSRQKGLEKLCEMFES